MLGLSVTESLLVGLLWLSLLVESLVVLGRGRALLATSWWGRPRRDGWFAMHGMRRTLVVLSPLPTGPVHEASCRPAAGGQLETIAESAAHARRTTAWLFPVTAGYAAFLGVLVPAAVILVGLGWAWKPLAVTGGIYHLITLTLFWLGHRRLYPDDTAQRWLDFITMLVFPPGAVRAGERLTRPLLTNHHVLAVTWALGGAAAVSDDAAAAYRQQQHPLPDEPESPACLPQVLAAIDLTAAQIMAPPAREHHSCRRYCPRCRAQFVEVLSECTDCMGVELAAWNDESAGDG